MVKKGTILEDRNGNTLEFIEVSSETNGSHTKIKVCLQPNQLALACHCHEKSDEIYEILEGELTYEINHKKMLAKAGETIILPKAQAHRHYNDSANPVVMYYTITPSYDIEPLIETMITMWQNGKIRNGNANFLQSMVWVNYMESKIYFEGLSQNTQNFLAYILAPIASVFGYKKFYHN
ncbi:cupin domain-containing protein [Flectobacillus roseus]|uniref:Cupin domain-containing protein n=1 Tax=Flectobacillus roseus TaxID=502259 RepID=A0ABT6Y2H0_9BACT|nr:cupin domain-containing protein [Flectobacillus roseus]MDI9857767.1 cupin domain-containing protein [Flectobacillus roseus]